MKHNKPKHCIQDEARFGILYLHKALHDIHRATDGDGVPTNDLADAFGLTPDGWTEKAMTPDIPRAIEAVDWFLTDGVNWADHCGALKPAFLAVLQQIKKLLAETDWTPCRCKACTERRKKEKRD